MDPSNLANLVNVGAAGAVIAVVLLFLRFIEKRDKDWRDFFTTIRKSDGEALTRLAGVIDRLVEKVERLNSKFDKHDATEMEALRNLAEVLQELQKGKKVQPPRKAQS